MQQVEDGFSLADGPSSTHRAEERRQQFEARREMRAWQEDLRAEARALPWPPNPYTDLDGVAHFFPPGTTRVDRALMRVALTQSVQDRELAEYMRGRYIAIYGR
jgi:hypothetical protein